MKNSDTKDDPWDPARRTPKGSYAARLPIALVADKQPQAIYGVLLPQALNNFSRVHPPPLHVNLRLLRDLPPSEPADTAHSHNIRISVGTWKGPQRQKYMDADGDYLHHYRFGCFNNMELQRVAIDSSMAMRVLTRMLDATGVLRGS